ncbi:hypothetical protein RB195_001855 [Necator americanus]|uniref:Reverse transcriptase domain-containing protein n=1 Tax=Necator americanus TaxID=51031 RepID=A0ABR1DG82_NECAM
MKNGTSSGDDGISAEMLKSLSPSGLCEVTKIICSILIDERISDSWRHAPAARLLVDLEYADDVIFASSSAKLQHVVNLVSKFAAAYGLDP